MMARLILKYVVFRCKLSIRLKWLSSNGVHMKFRIPKLGLINNIRRKGMKAFAVYYVKMASKCFVIYRFNICLV